MYNQYNGDNQNPHKDHRASYRDTYDSNRYPPVAPNLLRNTEPQGGRKEKKGPGWGGVIALCLCFSLIFGAGGAVIGSTYFKDGGLLPASDSGSSGNSNIPASPVSNVSGKEFSLTELYVNACPSVVGITIEGSAVNIFGQRTQLAASGSGFIISEDGYIITNCHVVEGASSVKVTLYSGDSYDANIIGADSDTDVALLKINARNLKPVTLGDSDGLTVGQNVAAIGNPLGELTYTLTDGIVSALDREINVDGAQFNMLQTNAAINPGNSGGPLFDMYGRVVAITTAKYSNAYSGTIEGLGFAIPINDAMVIVEDLKSNGYVKGRPMLGISGRDVGITGGRPGYGQSSDVVAGIYVTTVESGSCAEKAGILPGDIIIQMGDKKVSTISELTAEKKNYKAGDTVKITVLRGDETLIFDVTFDEQRAGA